MEIAYWVLAGLLALFYLYAGGQKLVRSQEQLNPMMAWAGTTIPMPGVRAIGAVEVLGAIGLLLPPATGVAPVLALVAAAGFVVLQVLAGVFHVQRGEAKVTPLNWILVGLAAVLAWLATTWL
ncbi:MAG: DoxX family protein [Nocardioides sp.]|nr:DoxX family protein [Nocardioides sp.]